MPRTRPLGAAMRQKAEQEAYAARVKAIIRAETILTGLDLKRLAERAGLNYSTMIARLNNGHLLLSDLCQINAVLKFKPETLMALLGCAVKDKDGAA